MCGGKGKGHSIWCETLEQTLTGQVVAWLGRLSTHPYPPPRMRNRLARPNSYVWVGIPFSPPFHSPMVGAAKGQTLGQGPALRG